MKTATQKPFWENMQNPITMHRINPREKYVGNGADYNKKYYRESKLTDVS